MPLNKAQKITFAIFLRDNKEVLFGTFNPEVSKDTKREKWKEIFITLKSSGADVPDVTRLRKVRASNK